MWNQAEQLSWCREWWEVEQYGGQEREEITPQPHLWPFLLHRSQAGTYSHRSNSFLVNYGQYFLPHWMVVST